MDTRRVIQLKEALREVSEAAGMDFAGLSKRWKSYGIEFQEFSRYRTRVMVWDWSVPRAIELAKIWRRKHPQPRKKHGPENKEDARQDDRQVQPGVRAVRARV